MFLNAMTELFNVGGRWWWAGAMGDVCPPPDIWRSLFAPRATGRWRAFFFIADGADYAEGRGTLPCSPSERREAIAKPLCDDCDGWIFNRSRKEQR